MNTSFIDELSKRVYDKIGEKLLRDLQVFGIQLPDEKGLANYIRFDYADYVSPEEHDQYLIDNLGDFNNDDANSLMIDLAIHMAALGVLIKIRKELTNKNLIIENSLSELDDPKEFIPKE
jgi:hypothetical protein